MSDLGHSPEYQQRQMDIAPAHKAVEALMALAAFIRTGAGRQDPPTRFKFIETTGRIGVIMPGDDLGVDPDALLNDGLGYLENLIGVIAAANGVPVSRICQAGSNQLVMGETSQLHDGVDTRLMAPGKADLSPIDIPEADYNDTQNL